MTIRVLHTADWQLGKSFGRIEGDAGAALRDARFNAVERLATLAREQACDVVVVAGDVFDAEALPDRMLHRMLDKTRGFPGTWLLLPGNHDPARPGGVWERFASLGPPDGVVALVEPGPTELLDGRLCVLAAPLTHKHSADDLTSWMGSHGTPSGTVRLGLAHGSVEGVLPHVADAQNPIAKDRAEAAGLDYLALGDWHGHFAVGERCCYAGTPEPDRYTANDSGEALVVELPGPGAAPVVTRHRVGAHRWHALDVELVIHEGEEADELAALDDALLALDDPAAAVVRVKLAGTARACAHGRLAALVERWSGLIRHLEVDEERLRVEVGQGGLGALEPGGLAAEVAAELAALARCEGEEALSANVALQLLHRVAAA